MEQYRRAAIEAAMEAGHRLKELFGKAHTVTRKGVIDLVTEADLQAEEIILTRLRSRFPEHGVISEEQGAASGERAAAFWLVDPLDGTTNFAHNFPWFAVSIAFLTAGRTVLGVVYNPLLEELYWAQDGHGAFLGEKKLTVSSERELVASLMATGFPYDVQTNAADVLGRFSRVLPRVQGIRRAGSAALDLAQVAAGRFEGFYEMRLKPWDTAAGALLVTEAGGICTGFHGEPFDPFSGDVVASNGIIHEDFLTVLSQ